MCFTLHYIVGGWGFNPPSGFSQEGPINTQMHELGTIPTEFQAVQEKI